MYFHDDKYKLLAANSKTFAWAGFFLPRALLHDAAIAYHFCRCLDDAVDLADSEQAALSAITALQQDWQQGAAWLQDFQALTQRVFIPTNVIDELFAGVASDVGPVRLANEQALLRYCYRVAGTVGLMMSRIFGITAKRAVPFAIDLGIALQLTNIARDIVEDAEQDKVYLPATWLPQLSQASDLLQLQHRAKVNLAISRLVSLAERYYYSADQALSELPGTAGFGQLRVRFAIMTMSRLYAAIGRKIAANVELIWQGRVYVTSAEKAYLTLLTLRGFLRLLPWLGCNPDLQHHSQLHQELVGLPFIGVAEV